MTYKLGLFDTLRLATTMATSRKLLFIWVAIYSQIRLCMLNILILIITYYQITTVIIKITSQNIVIWE